MTADKEKRQERFVRWQGRTIAQLTYSVNLVLTLSVAALGFGASLLLSDEVDRACWKLLIYVNAMFTLLASTAFGIWCTINRLRDFRTTTKITNLKRHQGFDVAYVEKLREKTKYLGVNTWRIFWFQIGTFGAGVALLLVSSGLLLIRP